MEVPGRRQDQLTQTLIVILLKIHFLDIVPKIWEETNTLIEYCRVSSSGSSPDGEIPVLNYMRREVVGEAELQRTTLRDLGIVAGGSAALRVLYKKPEGLKSEQVKYSRTLYFGPDWSSLRPCRGQTDD